MNFRRIFINIFGMIWSPILITKLFLDSFIYIRIFEFLDFLSLRVLYRVTKGKIIIVYKYLSKLHNFLIQKKFKNKKEYSAENLVFIEILKKNGFYLFPDKINIPKQIDKIYSQLSVFSDAIPSNNNKSFKYKNLGEAKKDQFRLNTRFFYRYKDLIKEECVWEIISNEFIWSIAHQYLGDNFCLQSLHSWSLIPPTEYFLNKSKNIKDEIFSSQAQSFHYDLDWPIFLKFFICLDTVDKDSGPFQYVIGTHRNKRKDLFIDKRINKKEFQNLPLEYLIGQKGTFAAADTIGFHRDGRPKSKERTIIQLEFSSFAIGNPKTRTFFKRENVSKRTLSLIKKISRNYPRSLRVIMK